MAKKPIDIKIEGFDEVEKTLNKMDAKAARSIALSAMKKAFDPFVNTLKSELPGSIKDVVGVFRGRNKYSVNMSAGVLQRKGGYFSRQKAYWREHGTLDNRDDSHPFRYSRKSKTKRYTKGSSNWKGGIKARNDISKAANASEKQVKETFIVQLEKKLNNWIKRQLKKK